MNQLPTRNCRRLLLAGLVLAAALSWFGRAPAVAAYRRWHFNNKVLLGQRWLEAGRLERADDCVRQAWTLDAGRPESWRLASELAWRRAQTGQALDCAEQAARFSGNQSEYVLDWADLALAAGNLLAAEQALARLTPEARWNSPRPLRLSAQLAARRGDAIAARDHLNALVALDRAGHSPDLLSDEAQEGEVLLQTGLAADRRRGLERLERCAQDRGQVGRFALRLLVEDAGRGPPGSSILKWTQALLAHPLCTLEDTKSCLRVAALASDDVFASAFGQIRSKLAFSQLRSAELLDWLGQFGRTKEALEWARAVNSADVTVPPLFVAVAETFRRTAEWRDLESWTGLSDWGSGVSLIQLTYRWMALSHLGETEAAEADAVLSKLKAAAPAGGEQTLLAAQLLYAWGQTDRSVDLLWMLSDNLRMNVRALGMLIRHYQTRRDGAGLHRAFEAWRRQHPEDQIAAASSALFGSLSGAGDPAACERLAAKSLSFDPENEYLRCCLAVVLAADGRGDQALAELAPIAARWRTSHSVAFADGLALAAAGRMAEARVVLRSLDLNTLTVEEAARCVAVLR